MFPLEPLRENPASFSPASGGSGQSLVSLGLWLYHSNLSLCCHTASPWVFCICPNSPPKRVPVIGFRASLNQCDLILVTSPKTLFPNKATLTGPGDEDFNIPFWGTQFCSLSCPSHIPPSLPPQETQAAGTWISSPESYFLPLKPLSPPVPVN